MQQSLLFSKCAIAAGAYKGSCIGSAAAIAVASVKLPATICYDMDVMALPCSVATASCSAVSCKLKCNGYSSSHGISCSIAIWLMLLVLIADVLALRAAAMHWPVCSPPCQG
jgi:hypothetical protein